MNYHNQTYDQLNQPNNGYQNVGITETQMGPTNPYLNQNQNGGYKNNSQQIPMGMNGLGMDGNGMGAQMNGQMPGAMTPGFIGGMGAMGMPQMITDPRRFFFNGDEMTFYTRFQQMSSGQFQSVNEVVINIRGQQVSTLNVLGLTCTIIWGSFLIFPLILMCMDCWKRCVYPNFELSEKFYSSLSRLSQANLQSIVLLVTDNNFNKNKAKILYELASRQNSLIGFTFINYAQPYNYKQSQYSQFEQNMRPIKKLPIITDLRWYRQIVTI